MSTIALLSFTSLLATIVPAEASGNAAAATPAPARSNLPAAPYTPAVPIRVQRRFEVSFSPDLLVLHAEKYADMTATPFGLRIAAQLSPYVALTAGAGWMPNLIQTIDAGVRIYFSAGGPSPYAGADLGYLRQLSDEGPDRNDPFALGLVGFSWAFANGFEFGVEGAAGGKRAELGTSALLRAGLRLSWRFAGPSS